LTTRLSNFPLYIDPFICQRIFRLSYGDPDAYERI
jgi:hypothetical protein